MSVDPMTERPQPRLERPGRDGAILQVQAGIALDRWLVETQGAAKAVEGAVRARRHMTELARLARAAQQAREDAEQRHARTLAQHSPAGRQPLGFGAELAVLARTRSLTLVRSSVAVNRARRAEAEVGGAHALAVRKLRRHMGRIRRALLSWSLSSVAPAGVDQATWAVALQQALRQLFAAS
jgi:hypothetical protein